MRAKAGLQKIAAENGSITKFQALHVLVRPLAAILNATFQRGVFNKGNRSFSANHRPIIVEELEPLGRIYAVILNQHIASWALEAGIRLHVHGAPSVCTLPFD